MNPIAYRLAAVAALVAVSAGINAVPAGADSADDRFLALLDAERAPAVRNVPELITAAHRTCALLDEGQSFDQVVDRLTDKSLEMQPRPREKARLAMARFTVAAVTVYCPQHTDLLPS